MPTIIHCPHCLHPLLVPARARGKSCLCRQCGKGYRVHKREPMIKRLPASSLAELLDLHQAGPPDG